MEELQQDLDVWLEYYNNERPHTGKFCYGKTPIQTWKESINLTNNKILANHYQNVVSLHQSGEMETGNAGKQPVSNNLTDWNGQGKHKYPFHNNYHSKKVWLRKSNRELVKKNALMSD